MTFCKKMIGRRYLPVAGHISHDDYSVCVFPYNSRISRTHIAALVAGKAVPVGIKYPAAGISQKSAEWLGTFGIRAEGVIPNAIDAAGYRAAASGRDFRGELGLTEEGLMVAFVGRLIPEKGVTALIEASRDECLRSAGVTFVLAGDGPLAGDVSDAESSTLHWVGRLSREDTAALLLQSDCLCLPTRSEGFSTTLLEASACGCPSLVTDVGGARELIPDDGYGTIMPDASAETVVREVLSLCERRSDLPLMGERCRRLVEGSYGWDDTAAKLERALNLEQVGWEGV